jgi:Zn-dependent membrane protease YugP
MKKFQSIEKLDTAILYALELASSVSVLLLAFGLIASMMNVLTQGSVLTNNLIMQRIWAWTQCIAIDASVAGALSISVSTANKWMNRVKGKDGQQKRDE